MTLHAAQSADRPLPSLWARVAAWFAVAVLLCGSVAEAGHIHRVAAQRGTAAAHASVTTASESDSGANCLLCLLDGSAVPVHGLRSTPVLYRSHAVPRTYSSRSVPLSVPFALSNRPPPAA